MLPSYGPPVPTTTTRMTWLYNTLSRYGESFEFGQPSRTWLIDRLAISDYSSRRDRSPSEWWEDTSSKSIQGSVSGAPSGLVSMKSRVLSHFPSSASLRSSQRDAVPDLSLAQVLASSTYRADFENFMEENLAGPALPFREVVQEWQDKYKTAHVWDPKGLDKLKEEAVKIYHQFLSPSAPEKLDVDKVVVARLKKALKIETQLLPMVRSSSESNDDLDSLSVHQLLERAEQYADHSLARRVLDTLQVIPHEDQEGLCERAFAILTDKVKPTALLDPDDDGVPVEFSGTIFTESLKQVTQMLENLFLEFKQTDDYNDMFENDARSSTSPLALPDIDSSTSGDAGSEDVNADELALGSDGRVRCPPWYNTEGWRSLRCEILDLHTKLSNVRAIINVDSTTYRSSLADRDFRAGVVAEFAITNTTQYLSIRLRSGNRLAGILDLSMLAISQMAQGAETMHSVKQVSKNQNLAKMELKLKITCRREEAGQCSLQQVLAEGMKGGFTTSLARGLVSKKKRRFQQDGFDLDLSYVTDQLIAMGYPSSGAEGVYRNPLESVQKFFSLRHPQAYLLYNLCSERQYDVSKFQGRVRHFPCDDHNPPPFSMMKRFCEDVRQFLNEHPQHAVSVHCKAGKGRTGTMLAAYMCYTGMEPNSAAALSTFAQSRTKNGKGVTIPSQERYVHYFGKYCRLKRAGKRAPGRTTLILQSVNLHDAVLQSNSTIVFSVTQRSAEANEALNGEAFSGQTYNNEDKAYFNRYTKSLKWDMRNYVLALSDDVLFEFYEKTLSGNKVKLFQFWFNTRMAELKYLDTGEDFDPRLILEKKELDKASKDTKHKDYSPDFKVELVFALTSASGVVKSQELEEKFDPQAVARPTVTPVSPSTQPGRKLPPPLPNGYSKRILPSDRDQEDEPSRLKVTSGQSLLASNEPSLNSSSNDPTRTVDDVNPISSTVALTPFDNVYIPSATEIPEPSNPIPPQVNDPSEDGLEEHFFPVEPIVDVNSVSKLSNQDLSLFPSSEPPPPPAILPPGLDLSNPFQVDTSSVDTTSSVDATSSSQVDTTPSTTSSPVQTNSLVAESNLTADPPSEPFLSDDQSAQQTNDYSSSELFSVELQAHSNAIRAANSGTASILPATTETKSFGTEDVTTGEGSGLPENGCDLSAGSNELPFPPIDATADQSQLEFVTHPASESLQNKPEPESKDVQTTFATDQSDQSKLEQELKDAQTKPIAEQDAPSTGEPISPLQMASQSTSPSVIEPESVSPVPSVKVGTLPKTQPKVNTLPRSRFVPTLEKASAPPPPPPEIATASPAAEQITEETTEAFCERLFGTSKSRMQMALTALSSFGVEVPLTDMEPWIERDWLDFEKSTNKVIRAKVQTELAAATSASKNKELDRYETLRRQAEEAELALRAEIRAKAPPPPPTRKVQGLTKLYESVGKQ